MRVLRAERAPLNKKTRDTDIVPRALRAAPLRIAKTNGNNTRNGIALALCTFSHPDYTVGVGISPNSALRLTGLPERFAVPSVEGAQRICLAHRRSGIGPVRPSPCPEGRLCGCWGYYGRVSGRASNCSCWWSVVRNGTNCQAPFAGRSVPILQDGGGRQVRRRMRGGRSRRQALGLARRGRAGGCGRFRAGGGRG